MPNIPFPDVPVYPGVPPLNRAASAAVASSPALSISIGALGNILRDALQQAPQWGIFDQGGNQLRIYTSTASIVSAITGATAPSLSTIGIDFVKETRVCDFPVEGGHYASYNKVESPANPIVTLALAGSEDDRTYFLNAVDAACRSTDLYNVVTPEVTYVNYAIERYTYSRTASKGATLLTVEVSLKEIRQVTATFSRVTTAIVNPQNPAATLQVNNGMTQPTTPDVSTLKSWGRINRRQWDVIQHLRETAGGFHQIG